MPLLAPGMASKTQDNFTQKAAKFQANFQELKQKELNYQKAKNGDIEAASGGPDIPSQANWPSCYPVLRHDLDDIAIISIPLHSLCKYSLNLFFFITANFIINLAFMSVFFWIGIEGVFSLIYSALQAILTPILFFFISHYPLYRGALASKKLLLSVSVAGCVVELVLLCLMLVGILEGAAGGVFRLLNLLRLKHWILLPLTATLQMSFLLSLLLLFNQLRLTLGQIRSTEVQAEINQQAYNSVREDAFKNIRTLAKDILN